MLYRKHASIEKVIEATNIQREFAFGVYRKNQRWLPFGNPVRDIGREKGG
jgi:hypothetical protein